MLTKTGFTFSEWNTKSDGTGITYASGSDFKIGSANVILYAKWTTNQTYKVTYNGNGNVSGTVPVDGNNYETGATVTVYKNINSLAKIGYVFAGWNTVADGSGTNYQPADATVTVIGNTGK